MTVTEYIIPPQGERLEYPPGHRPGPGWAICVGCRHGWPCPDAVEAGISKVAAHRELWGTEPRRQR